MDAHVVPDTTRSTWTKEKDDSEVRTVMGWISIFRLPMIDTQKKQEGGGERGGGGGGDEPFKFVSWP